MMSSSSKQKGGRPGLPSQGTKKKDQSGRGRCPQIESHQPLRGKSFYLDVRRQAAKLKKDLEDLGGVVETFLSKDISYVVSDRPEVKLECSKNASGVLQPAASPAVSTPSPFQQSKDSAHGAVDSPSGSGGREGMVTRGKAIVQKATISKTYGTSNVLANARNWNVSIRYIDSVIKYINKEKQKMKDSGVKSPQTQAQQRYRSGTSKERKLSRPSLKVEDASRHYRPASKEMTAWPRLSFDGQSGSCPFDGSAPRDNRTVDTRGDKRTVDMRGDNRTVDTRADKRTVDMRGDKRTVDTRGDKRTVDSRGDKRSVDTRGDKRTVDTRGDKRTVDMRGDKRTVDMRRDKRTVDTRGDKRTVDTREDKRTVDTREDRTQRRADDKPDEAREIGKGTQTRTCVKVPHHRAGGKRNVQTLPTPSKQRNVGVKHSRRGYCECCLSKYSDLEKHLATEQHQSFVRESNYYVNLDTMIDEGPNMEQFLEDVLHHHQWQSLEGIRNMDVIDEVALVSSPSTKKRKKGPKQVDSHPRVSAMNGSDKPSATLHAERHQGQTATNQDPHKVGKSASRSKTSPRNKSHSLQLAVAEGGAAAAECCLAAARLEEDVTGCDEREEPSPHDNPDDVCHSQDNRQSDQDLVHKSSSSGNQLRGRKTFMDSQSPPKRPSRRLSRQQTHKSSPTSLAGNAPVSSMGQCEEASCQSPLDVRGARLTESLPSVNSPETPNRRKSSRLSLSAQRRRKQQDAAEVVSGEVVHHDQSADLSREKEKLQVPDHTPTASKRQRSLRLSLTARKRLLKESGPTEAGLQQVREVTMISSNTLRTSAEERLKDPAQTEGQGTSIETEHHQEETETTKPGPDVDVASPRTEQQTGSRNNSNAGQRHSKRKRNSTDAQDLRSTKRPKGKATNTCYAAQKKSTRLSNSKEETSEEIKTGGGAHTSQTNPQVVEGSLKRIEQDHTDNNTQQEPAQTATCSSKPPTQPMNLASVFDSDPNMIESSFLGFSSDDITETEQRLQQMSASSTMYTSKLQEAALNVCCIPSSELNLPEDDDSGSDSSENSDMEEVCVGMALRNLANFPSDGSEWEAKVGGFMSGRLDEAVQLKEKEAFLARAYLQEKENIKENQYRQVINIPSKLVSVEAREQENVPGQSEQSPKKAQSKLKIVSQKDVARPKVVDSELSLPRRTLDFGGSDKSRSNRQNVALKNQSDRLQSSPLERAIPSRKVSSPVKTPKPLCSTPKRGNRPPEHRKYKLMFSPDTPKEDREIIIEHYVHDVSENEIDFPKFSSPRRADTIMSPVRRFAKGTPRGNRAKCGSPYKLKSPRVLRELPCSASPRKTLFPRRRHSTSSIPCRVFHFLLNPPGSPRKRDVSPSLPSSPLKQSSTNPSHSLASPQPDRESLHQITYIPVNERNKVSPTFCSNSKPHFSPHILHPPNKKRRNDRLRSTSLAPLRRARTWSMCVSFDDIGRCEDVYEFTDDRTGDTEGTCHQSGPRETTDRDSNRKAPNQPNRRTSHEDKSAQTTSKAYKDKESWDSSDEIIEEFGLPFSFFM